MRFISRHGGFALQIRPPQTEAYASGAVRVVQDMVQAKFHVTNTRPEEVELAVDHWHSFNGFYQQADEVTIVSPDYRIGVFDSELAQLEYGWDDELRHEVERKLLAYVETSEDVIAVPVETIPPPWPRYDEYAGSPSALLRKLIEDGHDLEKVLAYEQANQNRPNVVAAIERELIIPSSEPDPEEVLG